MRCVLLLALAGVVSVASAAIAAPRFQSGFLSYDIDVFSFSAAVGDLDGDGHPDIVVSYPNARKLGVLHGSAGGTFTVAESLSTQYNAAVAIADLNGDG